MRRAVIQQLKKKTMLFAPSISIPRPLGTIFTVPCYCSSSVRLTAA